MKSRNNIHHKKKNKVNNSIEEYKDVIPDIEIQIENLLKKFHIIKYDYKITHFLIDIIQNESLKILKNAKHIKKNIYFNNHNINDDNINDDHTNNIDNNNDNINNVKENEDIKDDTLYEEKYIQEEEEKIDDINNNIDMQNINEKNSPNESNSQILNELFDNFNEDSVIEKSSHIDIVVNNTEKEKVNINDDDIIEDKQIDDDVIEDKPIDDDIIGDKPIDDDIIGDKPIDDDIIGDKQIDDDIIGDQPIDDDISNKLELSLSDIFNTVECTSNNIQEQENKDQLNNKDILPNNKNDIKENNHIVIDNSINYNINNKKNLQNIVNNKNKIHNDVLIIDEESVNLAIKEYIIKTIYRKKNVDFLYEKLECQQKDNLMINRNIKYPSGLPPYLPDDCSVNTILPSWDIKYNFNSSKRKIKK
ncbi:hypothetical protein PGSY75_1032700 [Plasmodium gaboni]|uniref:Uncharacterized protein n=1 Tax=Plasmodium gaboni TaxID=647221 RepID=A0A151LLF5_9APIC|nr:hypothetical protein PGSY75_1032700 [Plasmodium gaboni]KYN99707.1 hypothetical protein PGSY75_1032700 [Plasmodium gaboni]